MNRETARQEYILGLLNEIAYYRPVTKDDWAWMFKKADEQFPPERMTADG